MLKVFGFVRRNEQLTHDEYRSAHAGYHNSYGRRLNRLRGYLLNVRANRTPEETLGNQAAYLTACEPADFDTSWDGYGQLMFDSLDNYLSAKSPARDKPGPQGLELDESVAAVGGDGPYLYSGPPIQFHVSEHVVIPVRRPEHKLFKLVLFARRRSNLSPAEFKARWAGRYSNLARNVPGLLGCIVNFPTELDVISGFFTKESGAFDESAIAQRKNFLALFDGMAEYWFSTPQDCIRWRAEAEQELRALEEQLFDGLFIREVDETVAVLPDRLPPPPFYHR